MTKDEFQYCFDQFFDEIRNFISYRCGDPELATDIAQEAFIKLWEKDFEYREHQTKGLLYKIAKELWLSRHRKNQSAEKYQLSFKFSEGANNTEEHLFYEELKVKYEEGLAQMPEKRRTVFLMSRFDELSYKEIAERLEVSVKTVEKRMHLALQELRKTLNYG